MVQSDVYNRSRLATTLVLVLTSNTALAAMPGNVFLPAVLTGLPKDSVADVTAMVTVDRRDLDPHPVGSVREQLMISIDRGMRQVLDLG